jgi:hypothetical protein
MCIGVLYSKGIFQRGIKTRYMRWSPNTTAMLYSSWLTDQHRPQIAARRSKHPQKDQDTVRRLRHAQRARTWSVREKSICDSEVAHFHRTSRHSSCSNCGKYRKCRKSALYGPICVYTQNRTMREYLYVLFSEWHLPAENDAVSSLVPETSSN